MLEVLLMSRGRGKGVRGPSRVGGRDSVAAVMAEVEVGTGGVRPKRFTLVQLREFHSRCTCCNIEGAFTYTLCGTRVPEGGESN